MPQPTQLHLCESTAPTAHTKRRSGGKLSMGPASESGLLLSISRLVYGQDNRVPNSYLGVRGSRSSYRLSNCFFSDIPLRCAYPCISVEYISSKPYNISHVINTTLSSQFNDSVNYSALLMQNPKFISTTRH